MTHTITLIPGDGIGPEVTEAVLRILGASGVKIEWDRQEAGITAFERYKTALPVELLDSVKRTRVALKGPVTTPIGEGFTSVNVGLRKALDLYANLRPVWSMPGVPSRFSGIDLVIVRENTEDLYSGLEHEVVPGVVESLKIISEKASRRIAEFAFAPRPRERPQESDGRAQGQHHEARRRPVPALRARRGPRRHGDVAYDERIVDAACMQLVMKPETFDVLVLPNLYGDIVSDLCAGLVGGLGVVPGANLGHEAAVFEAVHGSAPDIAGKNLANPTALLLSALHDARSPGRDDGCRSRSGERSSVCSRPAPSALAISAAAATTRNSPPRSARRSKREHERAVRRDPTFDDITRAVLAREEVVAYLNGSHGESGAARRGAHPRIPRGAAHAPAIPDLPRAEASALPDPPQDRRASPRTKRSSGCPRREAASSTSRTIAATSTT